MGQYDPNDRGELIAKQREYIALCEQVLANLFDKKRLPVGTMVTPRQARPSLGELVEVREEIDLPPRTYQEWTQIRRRFTVTIPPIRGRVEWSSGPLSGQTHWHDLKDLREITPDDMKRAIR